MLVGSHKLEEEVLKWDTWWSVPDCRLISDYIQQFTYFPTTLPVISTQYTKTKRSLSLLNHKLPKHLEYRYNPNSKHLDLKSLLYKAEILIQHSCIPSHAVPATINPTIEMSVYYQKKMTLWESHNFFILYPNKISPREIPLVDMFVYAVQANTEIRE